MTERNFAFDFLKAFAIIGVVFIHGSGLFFSSSFNTFLSECFRIAVPLFIIVWSYFFYKGYNKGLANDTTTLYSKKKFIYLFRVYLFWSLLYFIILADFSSLNFKTLLTKHFTGFGWSGQYYFVILFQFILLFPWIIKLYNIKFIRIVIIFSVVIIYILSSYFHYLLPSFIFKLGSVPFLYWVPYVFAGFHLSKIQYKERNFYQYFLLVLIIVIPFEFYFIATFTHNFNINPYLLVSILCISLIWAYVFICTGIAIYSTNIKNAISYIGQNTMTIFVTNPLIIIIIKKILNLIDFRAPTFYLCEIFYPLISVTIILTLTLLLVKLIKISRLNGIIN